MANVAVAGYRRLQLWFWGKFFILLIALGAGLRRRRMSHNNGIAGRGTIRVVDNPEFPPTDFFEAGRTFPCRLRHACGGYMDDAMKLVRSASLKFADTDYESPLDIQMNTGDYCFFWNARSFLEFAFSRQKHNGIEYVKYYKKHPWGRISAAAAQIRDPSSYAQMFYHSHTPFAWNARDGKPRYVRFRLVPEDKTTNSGEVDRAYIRQAEVTNDPALILELADQKTLPGETRSVNYLKNEWRDRVQSGRARYYLQIQLHEASPADEPDVRNPTLPWDEATHPHFDLATVEINEVLTPDEATHMAFEVTNHPKSVTLLPAESVDDYNSLNYMRAQSIWAIRTRRAMLRMFGYRPGVPDNGPHNLDPSGM